MLQNCAQSNCRIIPKKLRDMKREEICRLLADKVNKLKNKENGLSELLPDVRLLYGETPFAHDRHRYFHVLFRRTGEKVSGGNIRCT